MCNELDEYSYEFGVKMLRGVTVGAVAGRDYLFNPIVSSFLDGITMIIKFSNNIVLEDVFLIISCFFNFY